MGNSVRVCVCMCWHRACQQLQTGKSLGKYQMFIFTHSPCFYVLTIEMRRDTISVVHFLTLESAVGEGPTIKSGLPVCGETG